MKSNYTIKEWIEAVRRGFTPDGRQLAEVAYNTKSGTLLQGQIETFAGDSPIPIGKDKNKWKFKGRSVVLTSDNIADGTRFLTAWLSISS
jgi:hypothetical protein